MKQRDLEQLLIANHAMMVHVREFLRLSIPFLWTMEDCKKHFRGRSPEWIREASKRWAGYHGTRGKDFVLTVHQVKAIEDGYLDEASKQQGDPLSIHLHPTPQGAA